MVKIEVHPGLALSPEDAVGPSADNYHGTQIIVFPYWRKFKALVKKHWDLLKTMQPPFSIDNTPVHSSVNEKIRLMMLSKYPATNGALGRYVSGFMRIGDDVLKMVTISNKGTVHFDDSAVGSVYTGDLLKAINMLEKQIRAHYTVRKISAPRSYCGYDAFGQYSSAVFLHVSAWQSVIRLVKSNDFGLSVMVHRNGPASEDAPASVQSKHHFEAYTNIYARPISRFDARDYSRYGMIIFSEPDSDDMTIPPYYVLRNCLHVKSDRNGSHGRPYSVRFYFYTESIAVKMKDELMMNEPSSLESVHPIKVVESSLRSNAFS